MVQSSTHDYGVEGPATNMGLLWIVMNIPIEGALKDKIGS
jgi:hypothetical protein